MLVVGYTIKLCSNSDGDEEDDLPMRVTQISESRPPINITLLPIMTARKSQKVSPLSLASVSLLQALLARLIAHSAHWALALSLFFLSLSPLLAFQPVHQYIHAHKSLRCSACAPPPPASLLLACLHCRHRHLTVSHCHCRRGGGGGEEEGEHEVTRRGGNGGGCGIVRRRVAAAAAGHRGTLRA